MLPIYGSQAEHKEAFSTVKRAKTTKRSALEIAGALLIWQPAVGQAVYFPYLHLIANFV